MAGTIIFNLIIAPLEYLFEFVFAIAYRLLNNPLLILTALSIVVNLFALPLYKRADAIQEEENAKQAKMAHWVNHIKKTFKGDERYMMLTAYYRQENYKTIHSLRGSFSILLQIPFFIAAYHFLSNLEILKSMSFWVFTNLGEPDGLLKIGALSIDILPIIMTLINVISAYIYLKGASVSQKIQTYVLAAAFLVLLYTSPSGLVIYWTCNQIFSLLKNIFMKLVKNDIVLGIFVSIVGIIVFLAILLSGHASSKKKLAFIILILICCQIPLIVALLKRRRKNKPEKPFTPVPFRVYFLTVITITIFAGVIIPLSVISSSPVEFLSELNSPLKIVLNTASVMAGVFIVWCGIFYFLGTPKARTVYAYVMFAVLGVSVADFFFFAKGLGTMSESLVFDREFSFDLKQKLFNLLIIALVIAACLLIMRFFKRFMTYVALVLMVASIGFSITNAKTTVTGLRSAATEDAGSSRVIKGPVFNLSKTGKNVIVLMLDRSMSLFVPQIFEEKPSLKKDFTGFTYYPNTVSFASFTLAGAPALFGGYEYMPAAMNERSDTPRREKHNEALKLMPSLFGSNGYEVTAIDLPCPDYVERGDYSLFDGMENVNAMQVYGRCDYGRFNSFFGYNTKTQNRNFIYYSIMKSVPLFLQGYVYDYGNYYALKSTQYSSETFAKNYAVLSNLPEFTGITDDPVNTALIMDNETTHAYTPLTKNYEPGVISESVLYSYDDFTFKGYDIRLDSDNKCMGWQAHMATFIKLSEWFKYLKANGVWDNTRIVLVSDHGYYYDDIIYKADSDHWLFLERYNPLLMVKDFDSDGEIETSDEFMTNADVPTLAMNGLINNPVNPATGNPVTADAKNGELFVTTSTHWQLPNPEPDNTEFVFDTSDGAWWSVHDNIFEADNWEFVREGDK